MQKKDEIYRRGRFWLDYARGAGGAPVSRNLYICWYDAGAGRQRRKSTGVADVQSAIDALDAHFLAQGATTDAERDAYTVLRAMTDYFVEVGGGRLSADSIRARLLLFTRFVDAEAAAGRLPDPLLPAHLDDGMFVERFRAWATADPIVARRKNAEGEWVRDGARRKRSAATVEESVIAVKAALNHASRRRRVPTKPSISHLTRRQVTPVRNDRLSLGAIGELLDYSVRGGGPYAVPDRLLPLRRYLIAAICTLARPDAVFDISTLAARGQWLADVGRLDLNPAGRVQTRKYRAVVPVPTIFREWLEATDDRFVCRIVNSQGPEGETVARQVPVASVRSAWDGARQALRLPAGWGVKLVRHSMATVLANRGVDPVQLKIAMGHIPLGGVTERYVIYAPEYLGGFLDVLNDVLADLLRHSPGAWTPPLASGHAGTRRGGDREMKKTQAT